MAQGLLKFIVGLAVVASVALATSAILAQSPAQWTGTPTTPQPVAAHSDFANFAFDLTSPDPNRVETVPAQHGPNCEGPPATHSVSTYADSIYLCSNHLMTALNCSGYCETKITPNRLLNFAQGATVQWDMSTEIMSGRDWISFFITPFDQNVVYDDDRPDPNIGPRTGIQVRQSGGWHLFRWDNFVKTQIGGGFGPGSRDGINTGTNQSAVRQTFRLTISTTHMRMERIASATAPVPIVFFDVDIAGGLPFSSGVVTWGHHSYNPTKADCPACLPATWHWDEFQLTPSTEFTLIKADRRYVCEGGGGNHPGCPDPQNKTVTFAQPAPVDAYVRFSTGSQTQISTDNGVTWVNPRLTDNSLGTEFPRTIFQLVPAGTTKVMLRFTSPCGPLACTAQDFTIWSLQGGAPSTPAPPASTQTPISTSTVTVPTPTPIIVPTSTPPPPASTSSPQPTATLAPPPIAPTASATPPPASTVGPSQGTCEYWHDRADGTFDKVLPTDTLTTWFRRTDGTTVLKATRPLPNDYASAEARCN